MFPSFAPCVSLLVWVQMVRKVARENAIEVVPTELGLQNQSATLAKHWVITTFAQGFITPLTHNLLKQHAPVRPTNILARPFHCHATCKFPHIKACEYMARHSRMTVVEDLVTWFVGGSILTCGAEKVCCSPSKNIVAVSWWQVPNP